MYGHRAIAKWYAILLDPEGGTLWRAVKPEELRKAGRRVYIYDKLMTGLTEKTITEKFNKIHKQLRGFEVCGQSNNIMIDLNLNFHLFLNALPI